MNTPIQFNHPWVYSPCEAENVSTLHYRIDSEKSVITANLFASVSYDQVVRTSGILLPIQSLPHDNSPGSLRSACVEAIGAFSSLGLGIWQILPLNPPDFVGSPYASPSAFALDPDLLDPLAGDMPDPTPEDVDNWLAHNQWAEAWSLYRLLKSKDSRSWTHWGLFSNPDIEMLESLRMENYQAYENELITQWKLAASIKEIERTAKSCGILLMGDLPLYVAHDSADVWSNKGLFNVELDGSPIELSGAPPDDFNHSGQFWGNPTYRWEVHESTEFEWWRERMRVAASRTPGIRLDHFIGIAEYWAIPGEAQDATFGTWKKGPGSKLLSAILGIADFVIAEDLGMAGDDAIRLRDKYGLHGMSILQFGWDTEIPPHHINCVPDRVVAYTGTHDNDTFRGWYSKLPPYQREKVRKELGCPSSEIHKEAIKRLLQSNAEIVVIPLQDILGLGSSSRMNTPGMVSRRNWSWVSPDDWISRIKGSWFSESVKTSGRLPWSNE